MPLFKLSQRLRLEVYISFDEQSKRTVGFLQLLERKVAVLDFEPRNQTKEDIFAIELAGIPCPIAVWGEKFYLSQSVRSPIFATVEFGQPIA